MKLAYPLLDKPIETEENRVSVLIVENAVELRLAIENLRQQTAGGEGQFVLSKNGEITEFSKKAVFASDLFALELDSKKMALKINQYAVRVASEFEREFQGILSELNQLASRISIQMEFEASFSALESTEGLIKLLGFYVDENSMDYTEKLIEYMRLHRLFFGTELFIFFNLKAVLSVDELTLLYKAVAYEKLTVLLIEDCQRSNFPEYEKTVIIDKDLCVF